MPFVAQILRPRASTCTGSRELSLESTNDSIKKEPCKMASQPSKMKAKYDLESWGAAYNTKVQRWTLTHCYFADMGGIVVAPNSVHGDVAVPSIWPLQAATAHCLVQCCLPNGCNPLEGFAQLSKQEIDDRSNGDCLIKTFTTLQIL